MKMYESEAKEILAEYGLSIPSQDAEKYVVKAQVLAKNRKKHGGIKFAETQEEARKIAEQMQGSKVNGHEVNDVLIEEKTEFEEEY